MVLSATVPSHDWFVGQHSCVQGGECGCPGCAIRGPDRWRAGYRYGARHWDGRCPRSHQGSHARCRRGCKEGDHHRRQRGRTALGGGGRVGLTGAQTLASAAVAVSKAGFLLVRSALRSSSFSSAGAGFESRPFRALEKELVWCDEHREPAGRLGPFPGKRDQRCHSFETDHGCAVCVVRPLSLSLSEQERAVIDHLLAEQLASDDGSIRFDALALIDEFRITSALPALRQLAMRLETERDWQAPFERKKVIRIIDQLDALRS
jgi:hypothetical protein